MNAHNEQQARSLLALGLDEFGHHTEAENVRKGIDLDDYKVDLWAIRAALDTRPAAAQEAVAWQRRYKNDDEWFNISKHTYDETVGGKWAEKYDVRELYAAPVTAAPAVAYMVDGNVEQGLFFDKTAAENMAFANCGTVRPLVFADSTPATQGIDASPKGDVNEQFGSAEGLGSPKGGSEARDAARYRWLRDPDNYPQLGHICWWSDVLGECNDCHSFDAAIDAAMQAQAGDAEGQP